VGAAVKPLPTTPQLVPVYDTTGEIVDVVLDSTFLAACREREDRYNEVERRTEPLIERKEAKTPLKVFEVEPGLGRYPCKEEYEFHRNAGDAGLPKGFLTDICEREKVHEITDLPHKLMVTASVVSPAMRFLDYPIQRAAEENDE